MFEQPGRGVVVVVMENEGTCAGEPFSLNTSYIPLMYILCTSCSLLPFFHRLSRVSREDLLEGQVEMSIAMKPQGRRVLQGSTL